jgi:hypothetical protein
VSETNGGRPVSIQPPLHQAKHKFHGGRCMVVVVSLITSIIDGLEAGVVRHVGAVFVAVGCSIVVIQVLIVRAVRITVAHRPDCVAMSVANVGGDEKLPRHRPACFTSGLHFPYRRLDSSPP